MRLTYTQEQHVIGSLLRALGAREDEARVVSTVLAEGDVRGFGSHGILRLPYIVSGIRRGTIRVDAHIHIVAERPATALIDGEHGLGHYVASEAMKTAIRKAKATGAGLVGVHNTNHFGIAGYYAELAMQEGLVGVVMTTTDPLVHPFGGVEPILGTNAFAVGIPHSIHPILLDMATSAAARGKILEAKKLGKQIPPEWAVDSEGHPTSDPAKALAGALSPFGGAKGYGLGVILAILAGPLVRAEAGRKVRGTLEPMDFSTKGDLMLAIDPEAFTSPEQFESKVGEFVDDIKGSKKAPGFMEILLPGEPEYKTRERALREGVPIADTVWQDITKIAGELRIDLKEILVSG